MDAVVGLLVVGAVVAAVLWPLWRPAPQPPAEPVGAAARLQALEERKAEVYGAIREVGFDYRMDKLLEDDYREEVERLKSDAMRIVRQIEELRSAPPRGSQAIEDEIAAARQRLTAAGAAPAGQDPSFCTRCGHRADPEDVFCGACGARLKRTA